MLFGLFGKPSKEKFAAMVLKKISAAGVPTLLPVVDELFLVDPTLPEAQRVVGRAPWVKVFSACGDHFLETKMFPTRDFVSRFLSAEELRRILR